MSLIVSVFGLVSCYHHARPDAPARPPSDAATTLVAISSGTFTMGDLNGEPDEYPERRITVSAFQIERHEVSNASYVACVRARACDESPYANDPELGAADRPVIGIRWIDADRYCKWLGRRLPTEAEWEYAARGSDLRRWPWMGAFQTQKANTAAPGDPYPKTAPVESYEEGASPFGLLHMSANAAEWVADYYDPTFHRTSAALTADPLGPPTGHERVVRGGSYRDAQHNVRVSARRGQWPTESDSTIGFRCAK